MLRVVRLLACLLFLLSLRLGRLLLVELLCVVCVVWVVIWCMRVVVVSGDGGCGVVLSLLCDPLIGNVCLRRPILVFLFLVL